MKELTQFVAQFIELAHTAQLMCFPVLIRHARSLRHLRWSWLRGRGTEVDQMIL